MKISIPKILEPGQQLLGVDPYEPPTEWMNFTIVRVNNQRVELLSPSQEQTWAESSEVVVIQ